MHCNAKTMIKTAAVLGGILAGAYLALPEAREFVAASAPLLLALVCPVTMIAMMFMMRGTGAPAPSAGAEQQPRRADADQAQPAQQQAKASHSAAP